MTQEPGKAKKDTVTPTATHTISNSYYSAEKKENIKSSNWCVMKNKIKTKQKSTKKVSSGSPPNQSKTKRNNKKKN